MTGSTRKGTTFCFTDFYSYNITLGYKHIFEQNKDIIRAIGWGIETCPKTGKKHNQGYVQFYTQSRGSRFQKLIDSKCHLEPTRGSIRENYNYCTKEGFYEEFGTFVTQGTRTDLATLHEQIKNGKKLEDIADENPETWIRYHRGLTSLHEHMEKKELKGKMRTIDVTVLCGDAGVGKTRKVYEDNKPEDIFKIDEYENKQFLFNGYDGEEILLLDDFNGQMTLTRLLHILDRYPYKCNVKNGLKYARWNKVYITSNAGPDSWYKTYTKNLHRRLSTCLKVTQEGNTEPLGTKVAFGGYSENKNT